MRQRPSAEVFELFRLRADSLLSRRLVREGSLGASFTISWAQDEPLKFTLDEPDGEDWRSLLTDFRPFVSKGENIYIPAVHNLLWQLPLTDDDRELANAARALYKRSIEGSGMVGTVIDDEVVTGEVAFDLYFNGHVFHSDPVKTALWQKLGPMHRALIQHKLYEGATEGTRVVLAYREVLSTLTAAE